MNLTKPNKADSPLGPPIELAEMRSVLRAHRGAIKNIAEALGVSITSVLNVLNGRSKSARIARACEAKARELAEGGCSHAA